MQPWAIRVNAATIALHVGIDPVLVHVTVEGLPPISTRRKSDLLAMLGFVRKANHNDNIVAHTWNPTLKCEHAILVMDVNDCIPFATQRLISPAQCDKFPRKA